MKGWIKLHRKFTKWEWYHESDMVHLFIHLLLSARFEPGEFHGIKLDRGQLITGRNQLSDELGIKPHRVRTILKRLKKTGVLTSKSTNKYTILTICKYEDYQVAENEIDQEIDQQLTSKNQKIDQENDQEISQQGHSVKPINSGNTKDGGKKSTNRIANRLTSKNQKIDHYNKNGINKKYIYLSEFLKKSGRDLKNLEIRNIPSLADLKKTYVPEEEEQQKKNDQVILLALKYMHEKLSKRWPDHKVIQRAKVINWFDTIERTFRIDEVEPKKWKDYFDWAYNDEEFWADVIRSPESLRKHWDKIDVKYKKSDRRKIVLSEDKPGWHTR